MDEGNRPYLSLNNKRLTLGEGGINSYNKESASYIQYGRITARGSHVILNSISDPSSRRDAFGKIAYHYLNLNAVIQDHETHKVGIIFNSKQKPERVGYVFLGGKEANTFTGEVTVSGAGNAIFLAKEAGATAVRSNIYVRDGGRVGIAKSNQIADSSTVTLSGNGATFSFTGYFMETVTEKIHALVIESGGGVFSFAHHLDREDHNIHTLYLDDLIINDGASLRVVAWEEGRDHLLVRKDSKHLADAMRKISIDGWAKNQVYLRDYDKDYWSIEAAPEPATCGAVLGAVGVALWRRRKRKILFRH